MPAGIAGGITLREAADRLGVHYMTVYRHVRLGLIPAARVGRTWRIDPDDLAGTRKRGAAERPAVPVGRPPAQAPWATRLCRRMCAGDVEGSWQVVESAMASGMAPADVHVELLGPALHAIGAMWREGEIGVGDEHLASGVAGSIVGRLGPRFRRRGRRRGTVLVAMPAGERHGIGAAMVSDILRGDGFGVLNLGPDTPTDALVAAIAETDDLAAVVVSVVDTSCLPEATRLIGAARRRAPAVPIVAGGHAVADEAVARSLGAGAWAADPRRLAAMIGGRSARAGR